MYDKDALITKEWGHLPGFREYRKEFKSACPHCGGDNTSDRFIMFKDGESVRGWCRQERKMYFADSQSSLSDAERERYLQEALRKQEEEHRRDAIRLANLQQSEAWVKWHMSLDPTGINAWLREGITKESIERYQLGHVKGRRFFGDGAFFSRDALTIPSWNFHNAVLNVQFRMINPPPNVGKYRPIPNLPMARFHTNPNLTIQGDVLVVEGAKKAIVVQQEFDKAGIDMTVVAIPSVSPAKALLEGFHEAERVYLLLDPDAYVWRKDKNGDPIKPPVRNVARDLNANLYVAKLLTKPDDYFFKYGGSIDNFMEALSYAKFVKSASAP